MRGVPPPSGPPAPRIRTRPMSGLFRTLFAGYGAAKLGGGCLSTVLIFLLLYWLLGIVF